MQRGPKGTIVFLTPQYNMAEDGFPEDAIREEDIVEAFQKTEKSDWENRPGKLPHHFVRVNGDEKPVKAVLRNVDEVPEDESFTTNKAERIMESLGYDTFKVKRASGWPDHWITSYRKGIFGLDEDHFSQWQNLEEGDVILFHCTGKDSRGNSQGTAGLIGYGIIGRKYEDNDYIWRTEKDDREKEWKYIVEFKETYWTGNTDIIEDIPIDEKNQEQINKEMKALSEGRLEFGTIEEELDYSFPTQGSFSRASYGSEILDRLRNRVSRGNSPPDSFDNNIERLLRAYKAFYESDRHEQEKWKFEYQAWFEKNIASEYELDDLSADETSELIETMHEYEGDPVEDPEKFLLGGDHAGSVAWYGLYNLSEEHPNELSDVLSQLFDEEVAIEDRLEDFIYLMEEGGDLNPGSATSMATMFLTLAYPEKYILYKYAEIDEFFEEFTDEEIKTGKRIDQYTRVNELSKELRKKLSKYIPSASLLHVQDLIYYYCNYKFFWVTQKRDQELEEDFIQAPADTDEESHNISKVYDHDSTIIHYDGRTKEIVGYSFPEESEKVEREDGGTSLRIHVDFHEFEEPIEFSEVSETLKEDSDLKWYALNKNGRPKSGYFFRLTHRAGEYLLSYNETGNIPLFTDQREQDESDEVVPEERINRILESDVNHLDLGLPDGIFFPEQDWKDIKQQVESALESNQNIIFTGPPGTGKTELAQHIAQKVKGDDHIFTTATADWTAFDTIGGYMPKKNGESSEGPQEELKFSPGKFLECFREPEEEGGELRNHWLVIDEINRADIDKAFGPLFSVLSEDTVELTYTHDNGKPVKIEWAGEDREKLVEAHQEKNIFPVTSNWNLIATMNTYDKTSLYEMSYAFMRRFTFIHVGVPHMKNREEAKQMITENYAKEWDGLEDVLSQYGDHLAMLWKNVNEHRTVGPALIRDIAVMLEGYGDDNTSEDRAFTNAIVSYVFPQMEGLPQRDLEELLESLDQDMIDRGLLQRKAQDFFNNRELTIDAEN